MASSSSSEVKCGVFDVSLPARAIAPIHDLSGDRQSHFLVGSCATPDGTPATKNKISLLSYGEDKTFVNCLGIVSHDIGEVLHISTPGNAVTTDDILAGGASSSSHYGFFSTTHTLGLGAPNEVSSSVFRIGKKSENGGASASVSLDKFCDLPRGTTAVAWHPLKVDSKELRVVIGEGDVGVISDYTLISEKGNNSDAAAGAITSRYQLPNVVPSARFSVGAGGAHIGMLMKPTIISWDPIYNDRIIAARGTSLYQIDTRSKTGAVTSPNNTTSSTSLLCGTAHGFGSIRSVHSNRNELNLLVTAGDDGVVSFWDLRKAGNGPLLSHRVHDHWVQKVMFNRMSDKTLLTCSSDRSARVWQLGQAVPWGASEAKDGGKSGGGKARSGSHQRTNSGGFGTAGNTSNGGGGSSGISGQSLGEFGDAVMDCCWSAATPFVTAAVSYNGKVIVGTVSKSTRDGIYGL